MKKSMITCLNKIRLSTRPVRLSCSENVLPSPLVDCDVLNLIEAVYKSMTAIPVIRVEEFFIEPRSFGYGESTTKESELHL